MRAVETVARALARAGYGGRQQRDYVNDDDCQFWVEHSWRSYENRAADMLRALKGQPPHIVDAGCNTSFADGLGPVLDAMLEAMARA